MRRYLLLTLACVVALLLPSAARAQNAHIEGFGGFTFGDVADDALFGGGIAIPLSDNIQIVAEGGRMSDVMPSLVSDILDFTPVDVHVSAWYGEAGVRVTGSPANTVRPYAEATAGFARLRTGFDGPEDEIVNSILGVFDGNEPLLGFGGGVIVQGGPVFLDLGYRYKRILAGDSLQSLITGGDFSVNQVRLGVGVSF